MRQTKIPKQYKVNPILTKAQMPTNTSRFNNPQCITKSAFDKNLNAKANSKNANTFLTVSNQPPLLGNDCNQLGKIANNAKGNAKANPKPANPAVNCQLPPLAVPTNKDPKIRQVQEKRNNGKVNAIKKIPPILPNPLLLSALLAIPDGSVISKNPKNEIEKKIKMTKNTTFNQALVEILLKISG